MLFNLSLTSLKPLNSDHNKPILTRLSTTRTSTPVVRRLFNKSSGGECTNPRAINKPKNKLTAIIPHPIISKKPRFFIQSPRILFPINNISIENYLNLNPTWLDLNSEFSSYKTQSGETGACDNIADDDLRPYDSFSLNSGMEILEYPQILFLFLSNSLNPNNGEYNSNISKEVINSLILNYKARNYLKGDHHFTYSISSSDLRITTIPFKSEYFFNNLDTASFCIFKSLGEILSKTIPKCSEDEYTGNSKKSESREISVRFSFTANLKTSPFLMALGDNFTSYPNLMRNENSPLCTFSSNKNFILRILSDQPKAFFSKLNSKIQGSFDMTFSQRRICFNNFFDAGSCFKHSRTKETMILVSLKVGFP